MKSINIFLIGYLLMASLAVNAQQPSATLYHMSALPDRAFLNPAFQPEAKLYIGMPGFSQLHVMSGHSGFSYNELFIRSDTGFVIDPNQLLSLMPSVSQLGADVFYKPLAFGFRFLKKGYFTFDIGPRYSMQFFYPRDLLGLAWKGNGHEDYLGKRVSFDNMGVEIMLTNEISAGYSYRFKDKVTLGVRARMIQGIANIHMERSTFGLTTDADDFGLTVDLDYKINMSAPLVNFDSLLKGKFETFNQEAILDLGLEYLKQNTGFAWDFGGSWFIRERLLLSASVNNLGYVDWKGNTFSVQSKGTFQFDGFDFAPFVQGDTAADAMFAELLDSLMQVFKVETVQQGYRQILTPTVQFGAGLYLTKDDVVGFHLRNQFYKGIWFPKLTFSYNHRFGRVLSLSASYGMERGNFTNLGVGLALKMGPFQYYLISDNALAFVYPLSAKSAGVLTGMQWVFGTKQKKSGSASI
jgi:hypothetical protein